MKKHLLAAAVVAAVAAPAMAQNVTLFGNIDASIFNVTRANGTGNISSQYTDSAISSSIWGIRGSEDLGGGLRAVFEFAGDAGTHQGNSNGAGLFRRNASVGVASKDWGTIELGVKMNPLIAANGRLMPVAGNSVSSEASNALAYADFFTRNAVTWTTPVINGFSGQGQYGMSNSIDSGAAGTVTAWRLDYANGPFTALITGQARKGMAQSNNTLSAANPPTAAQTGLAANETFYSAQTGLITASATTVTGAASNDKDTLLFGARYKVNSQFEIGVAKLSNETTNFTTRAKTKVSGTQFGIGYQMSPSVLLGASITQAEGSRLTNMQARYSLSKRSTLYAQYGVANNDSANRVNFYPVGGSTNNAPALLTDARAVRTADREQTAVGVGIIHSF